MPAVHQGSERALHLVGSAQRRRGLEEHGQVESAASMALALEPGVAPRVHPTGGVAGQLRRPQKGDIEAVAAALVGHFLIVGGENREIDPVERPGCAGRVGNEGHATHLAQVLTGNAFASAPRRHHGEHLPTLPRHAAPS